MNTEASTAAVDSLTALCDEVHRLDREFASLYGLTSAELRALRAMNAGEGESHVRLSRRVGLSSGAITGAVDRLVARGLAERVPDPLDRRVIQVRLTERGAERLHVLTRPLLKAVREATTAIDERSVVSVLATVAEAASHQSNRWL